RNHDPNGRNDRSAASGDEVSRSERERGGMPSPLMRTQLVAPALALVGEAGGDVHALVTKLGLPETAAAAPPPTPPIAPLHVILDAAAEAARDPFLGLRIAARYPRGMYGLMEYASRTAPTLRDACAAFARYVALVNELVVIRMIDRDGGTALDQSIP